MIRILARQWPRHLVASATFLGLALLAACDPGPPLPPIELTVTATDAATPVGVGQPASVSFTVTNPGKENVAGVSVYIVSNEEGSTKIDCTAQGGTCPSGIYGIYIPIFAMPAGSRFTFVLTTSQAQAAYGVMPIRATVGANSREGAVQATAHFPAVDARSGLYELFGVSGLQTNLVIDFKPSPATFSISSGSVDQTLTPTNNFYTFPSGGHLSSAPDLLVGQADFGHGPDTFVAARNFVDQLADLDGKSFSTFNVVKGAAPSYQDPVSGIAGPLNLWQVAISGTTMTTCAFAVGTIDTCAAGNLRHYALTRQAGGGIVFMATDAAHNDRFQFQVARSGTSLIWLRAEVAPNDALFSIGFADALPPAQEHISYATLNGVFGLLDLTPVDWQFRPQPPGDPAASFAMPFVAGDDGLPGLLHGTRPTDGVELFVLQQGALTLTGTLTGEFTIGADRTP